MASATWVAILNESFPCRVAVKQIANAAGTFYANGTHNFRGLGGFLTFFMKLNEMLNKSTLSIAREMVRCAVQRHSAVISGMGSMLAEYWNAD